MSEIAKTIPDMTAANDGVQWIQTNLIQGLRGGPVVVTLGREKRSTEMNSKLWPMLTDIAQQVEWFGKKHSKEAWKEIITGSFRQAEFVPNIENTGFVAVGLSTSKMGKAEFSALIEYIYAFGAEKAVVWSEPALETYEQYRTQV